MIQEAWQQKWEITTYTTNSTWSFCDIKCWFHHMYHPDDLWLIPSFGDSMMRVMNGMHADCRPCSILRCLINPNWRFLRLRWAEAIADSQSRFMWTLGTFKSVYPRKIHTIQYDFFRALILRAIRDNYMSGRQVWRCVMHMRDVSARLGHQVLQGLVTVGRYDGTDLGGVGFSRG